MTRFIKIVLVLALLWSGWWLAAGYGLRQSIANWFDTQAARGWQADYATLGTTGYPLRHVTRIEAPALADPGTGTAWQADWISFDSPAVWPGHQTLRVADTAQRLSYLDRTVTLTAADMTADLRLRPGLGLQLGTMALTSGPWGVADAQGPVMQAADLEVSMLQDAEDAARYALVVNADRFAPGASLRQALQRASALPEAFETLTLRMQVTFDRPWDRRAIEDRRPQPRRIDLALADAQWGALRLQAAGKVDVDAEGMPTGIITIKADNWREMLAMAQAAGSLPQGAVEPVDRALGFLAGLGGNPDALDVRLTLRDGFVALGPLPLGPAPRLILR